MLQLGKKKEKKEKESQIMLHEYSLFTLREIIYINLYDKNIIITMKLSILKQHKTHHKFTTERSKIS
jgi:hypothetical protein